MPTPDPRLKRFAYEHLKDNDIKWTAAQYYNLALNAIENHKDDPLLEEFLHRLWRAQSAALVMIARAKHDKQG